MLYPQSNQFRQALSLSGLWDFRFDPEDRGIDGGWAEGFSGGRPIAVPASWNDQFEGWRDYLGPAWYQARFDLPWGWEEKLVGLRFGSVNYMADVWLNGVPLGSHEGGHLPFEFGVISLVRPEGNVLVVRVEGELAPDRVPPGGELPDSVDSWGKSMYPVANFDFFPFCGVHRPVLLYATPRGALADLTVVTALDGGDGLVRVQMEAGDDAAARVTLRGHGAELSVEGDAADEAVLRVPGAALWAPGSPNLYELTVELARDGAVYDRYTLPIGIRTIAVEGDALLLNGEPIVLRGFCRHEDFPVTGRGLETAVAVKDCALMKWVGANSFRTSHYPYSEQTMGLADRLGFLVIDETPAVGLIFEEMGLERRLALCRQYVREMIARDKNHPSVFMWCLANEPFSNHPAARGFFRDLYDLAKSLDPTRPVTLANWAFVGRREEAFEFLDVVALNRFYGLYIWGGRMEEGNRMLTAELGLLHERFPKPLILSEFGADAFSGHHAEPAEIFSEEYQAEMLARYLEVLEGKPYVVGQYVWNLCDFKTGQGVFRLGGLNYKGVFTRDRRPKLAAHRLRELWAGPEAPDDREA
jgi:beta-glucuronidase